MAFLIGPLMVAGAIAGAIGQGISVANKQCELQHKVDDLKSSTAKYLKNMQDADNILKLENVQIKIQTQNLAQEIASKHRLLNQNYLDFKNQYSLYLVSGVIFIMLIIFAMAFKKFILDMNY
jgi:hypothetical protein